MSVGIKLHIATVQEVIVATAILHNLARIENEDLLVDENVQQVLEEVIPEDNEHEENNWYRNELIQQYFSQLL